MLDINKLYENYKAFNIIQIGGLPYTIIRIYKTDNSDLYYKTRFTAYCYINNRRIDAAIPIN